VKESFRKRLWTCRLSDDDNITIIFTKFQKGQGGAALGEEHVVGSVPFVGKSVSEMRLGKQATRNVVRARWFPSML
jgi:hypothetical protein